MQSLIWRKKQQKQHFQALPLPGLIQMMNWYLFYLSQKTGFDISYKLEAICLKCQICFLVLSAENFTQNTKH